MADVTYIQIENKFETTLAQQLTNSATDLTIYCAAVPTATIPAGKFISVVLSPNTTDEEIVKVSSIDTTAKTLTVASGGRAQNLGNAKSGTLKTHPATRKVIISADYLMLRDYADAIDSRLDTANDDTVAADTTWSSTTNAGVVLNSITTTNRDALASPANGSTIYNSTTGQTEFREGGAWVANAAGGSVADASETVAGKVEEATQAEITAGTATGGTGANLFVAPDKLAVTLQNQPMNFAVDAAANDTYVITLTPAPTAYAAGQKFTFDANTGNTGACTLNVNSLGAKSIKKHVDQDLATGDIMASQLVEVIYDGTNFQILDNTGVPAGSIMAWTTDTAPSTWLLCDGTTGLSTSANPEYTALFAVIGTVYGGAGATDFDLPDLRGRFILGQDDMGGVSANRVTATEADTLGQASGAETHALTIAELAAHTHTVPFSGDQATVGGGADVVSGPGPTTSSSTGSGTAHNNMSPYMTLNYIIKF